jgi:glycosyltransferase involved in cell wall biosynthesis
MRILHLPSSYLPETVGGTEVYVHHLCEGLRGHGHACAVAYHATGPDPGRAFDYEVYRLPERRPRRRADLYLHASETPPPGFADVLKRFRPDVVHFHALTLGAGPDHAGAARRAGIPYVVTYHTPAASCQRGALLRWGEAECDGEMRPGRCAACTLHGQGVPRPLARLLALSPLPHRPLPEGPWVPRVALRSLLAAKQRGWREFMLGAARVVACTAWCKDVLVRNGVPDGRITVARQALPGPDRRRRLRLPAAGRPLRLGFFGRCTREKGPDVLVRAVRVLAEAGLAAACELAGPVPDGEWAWLDSILAAEPNARWVGVKRGPDLTAWLDTLDVAVVPSRTFETGPLTLLEAWDRGVPVVGADRGGIRDFLRSEGLEALLFAPGDPRALAEAVRRAARWPDPLPEVTVPGMDALARRMESVYAGDTTA